MLTDTMLRSVRRFVLASCLLLSVAAGCGGKTAGGGEAASGDGSSVGGGSGEAGASPGEDGSAGTSVLTTGKLDLLFVIDSGSQMVGVTDYLQASVPALFDRLVNPECLDVGGNVLGPSSGGACFSGQLEFQPVADIHVGIVTSSLGGRGGDQCNPSATNAANDALSAHNDDRGELVNRIAPDDAPLPDASPSNFLAWFPPGQPAPPVPAIGAPSQLVGDFQSLVGGVGLHGCGFVSPLEAWYRFLVQPDPYASIALEGTRASYQGVDGTILQQRRDFLRPDSAVAIVVVANQNDRTADPLAIGGQGWAFSNQEFPGSPNGSAPEGSIECKTDPEDPSCTSCVFLQSAPDFATRCPKDGANGADGYLDPIDDGLALRFFHMKQRFGVDVEFPIERYLDGLTKPMVPDSAHEHDGDGNYVPSPDCTNPLFAAALPASGSDELCALPRGARPPGDVVFAFIGGVPHELLQVDPSNADSPQQEAVTGVEWTAILGADPLNYDFTGADFHMLESSTPRAQSPCQPDASDDCDPINGREWNTRGSELEYACVFPLVAPRDCTQPANSGACQCAANALNQGTVLCQAPGSLVQVRGAAYPTIRGLALAKLLDGGAMQPVVSSVCPIHTTESSPGDPLYAYRPAFSLLADRLRNVLAR